VSETTEILKWFEQLGKVSFGPLVGLLLFGNFLGIWVWGKFHRERIAEVHADRDRERAEKLEWKEMALGMLTPLESVIRTSKRG